MKILLINSIYTSKIPWLVRGMVPLLPNLGLSYVAANLERAGYKVKIIDGYSLSLRKGYTYSDFKKEILKFNPDVVGFTSVTPRIQDFRKAVKFVKNTLPNAITVTGGPHITAVPSDLMTDYGIYGEGEETFLEMVRALEKKKDLKSIPGLIYRDNDGKVKFQRRVYIKNIDDLPMPAWHLLPIKIYKPSSVNYRKLPALAMITSRGCPYACIYCHKPIFGNVFRAHSPERVIAEMKHLKKHYGIKDITIYDDTFSLDRERLVKILNMMIKEKINLLWNCTTRVDRVDLELLKLMKKAGCYAIGYGVESGSERIVKMIKKGVTKEQVRKAVKYTKMAGIEMRLFFMVGFPTETKKDILKTLKFAKELDAGVAQIMLVSPFPGTELAKLCSKKGDVDGDWGNFMAYSNKTAPFVPDTMTEKEFLKLYTKLYRSYYLRPKMFIREILNIRSFSDFKRKVIGTLYAYAK